MCWRRVSWSRIHSKISVLKIPLSELNEKDPEWLFPINRMCVEGDLSTKPDRLDVLKCTKNLTSLDVHDTELNTVPDCIYGCEKLEHLDLSKNKIKKVSEKISNLKNLRSLSLGDNFLKNQFNNSSFVDALENMKSLTYVSLGINHSNSIYTFLDPVIDPDSMAQFSTGKILGYRVPEDKRIDLSGKGLSRVPVDILNIKGHVKVLDLSNNNIRKLPLCLINMDKLEEIILCENPHFDSFDKIPDGLLKEGWTFTLSINNEKVSRTAKEIKEERIDGIQAQIKALQERLSNL